ncbi:MAG: alginate export family protein [Pseudomonadota bacterium]
MKFFSMKTFVLLPVAAACAFAGQQASAESDTFVDAIKNGKAGLSFRLRYEDVEVDTPSDDSADALTLRTRLNYTTDTFKGFGAMLEMDDITSLTSVNYNDGVNGKSGPAIADPEGTEVNQAYLSYAYKETGGRWGRQRIILDNARFIGNVGWRQNEQTYDALSISSKSLPDANLFAGYVTNVNRIFGEDSLVGDVDQSTLLLNASYEGLSWGKFTGYGYLLDADPSGKQSAAGANFNRWDTNTYGLRFAGSTDASDSVKVSYAAEYATQSDTDDNPLSYDADYYNLEAGITFVGVTVKLGTEMLGADGSDGFFITPMATLHKFQGWTDQFLGGGLGNIPGGIEDVYLSVGGKVAGIKLLAVYHDFTSDDKGASGNPSDDLGSEIGFLVGKDFGNYGLQLKYSDYDADDHGVDTEKLWLTASARF